MREHSALQEAKDRLDIPALWRLRGWSGEPGRECRRPYGPEDSRKSGSVFEGGRLFKDFKTGDVLDAPALLARVEGLDNSAACRLLIELAGVSREPAPRRRERPARAARPAPAPVRVERPAEVEQREKPELPALRAPEPHELDRIAESRLLSPRGPELAAARGLLWMCGWSGLECWGISDSSRWNLQLRRLDGLPFEGGGTPKKTLGVRGGWAAWPIGAADLGMRESVLLVEGSGDFLAAHDFAWREGVAERVAVVCIAGASVRLPDEALEFFRGRRVRIFPHLDASEAGEEGALRWETQLRAAGAARVECFDLGGLRTADGETVGDLNDLAKLDGDTLAELGPLADF